MNKLLKASLRVVGWTLTQAVIVTLLYEAGKEVASVFHTWRPDIGRGIFWISYIASFTFLALVANAILEVEQIGTRPFKRLFVWAVAFLLLVLYTLPIWPTSPLSVPFIHACAIATIIAREILNRFAPAPAITAAKSSL